MSNYIKRIRRGLYIRVLNLALKIERRLPIQKNVVFECESDMDDNPRAVYEYLLEKGYNTRHKMIWIVEHVDLCRKLYYKKNVKFLSRYDNTFKNLIILNYYLFTSKWFVFSHPWWFKKTRKEQTVIHINHGSGLKNTRSTDPDVSYTYDWLLVPSTQVSTLHSKVWGCTPEKMIFSGFPRNDFLFKGKKSEILSKLFEWNEDEKIIICMPTYKQSNSANDSEIVDRFSIDFISNENELNILNDELRTRRTHLIVKLHPLQRKDILYTDNLSNVHYISNFELLEKKIILYELIGKCDSLITDLSSVYTDYLLLDRSIAFFMNNIRNYKRGYLVENFEDYMPGKQIENYNDFISFVDDVLHGIDLYGEERKRVFNFFHDSNKHSNCDFFCKWMLGDI